MADPASNYDNVNLKPGGKFSINDVDFDASPTAQNAAIIGSPLNATITPGAEAGNIINVAIQLQDGDGTDLTNVGALVFYLADDAAGLTPSGTAPDGGIAIGTDGALIEWVPNLSGLAISEADGDIDIDMTESGAATWYLVLVLPNRQLKISSAITFA
jgi:hypothetical protein